MITKSNYVDYCMCGKLYYLSINNKVEEVITDYDKLLMTNGLEVGRIARSYFGEFSLITRKNKELMFEETLQKIKEEKEIICEASFIFNDCFCAVDILRRVGHNEYEIYEVKSASFDGKNDADYYDDCSFQYYVITSLGYKIRSVNLLMINKDYVFKDKLNIKEYFKCINVVPLDNVKDNLDKIRKITDEPKTIGCGECKGCSFFGHCYKDLPKNNVYKLSGLRNSYKLYNDGIITFEEYLDYFKDKANSKILEQIEFELEDKEIKVNKEKVKEFLDKIEYPIYHLDFETTSDIVPFINGTYPNYRRAIQYSLHIQEYFGGPLIHKEYLQEAKYDNQEEVIDRLILDLGDRGTIFAYHASFEASIIKGLYNVNINKKEKLENIVNRMMDLEIPFVSRNVYCKEMKGKSSIKYVLPALSKDFEQAYHDLPYVHNGTDAMNAYDELINTTGERHEFIKDALLKYCALDTLAMVEVLKKLYEFVEEKEK